MFIFFVAVVFYTTIQYKIWLFNLFTVKKEVKVLFQNNVSFLFKTFTFTDRMQNDNERNHFMKFISPSLHVYFQSSSLRNADNKTVTPPYLSCSFASLFRCCLKFLLNLSHVEKSEIKLSGKIICDFHNATFLRSYKVFKRALGHQEVNIKCFH